MRRTVPATKGAPFLNTTSQMCSTVQFMSFVVPSSSTKAAQKRKTPNCAHGMMTAGLSHAGICSPLVQELFTIFSTSRGLSCRRKAETFLETSEGRRTVRCKTHTALSRATSVARCLRLQSQLLERPCTMLHRSLQLTTYHRGKRK